MSTTKHAQVIADAQSRIRNGLGDISTVLDDLFWQAFALGFDAAVELTNEGDSNERVSTGP